jgi:anti-sigma-K factor RskA
MNNEIASDYYLERYALGELSEEDLQKIEEKISTDPELRRRIEEIELSNRQILSLYLPSAEQAQLHSRSKETQDFSFAKRFFFSVYSKKRIISVSSALLCAVLLFFLIKPGNQQRRITLPFDSTSDTTLVKGLSEIDLSSTQLLVFRKKKDSVDILLDGNRALEGDLLQLAYIATKKKYGMILSLDGRGGITLHFPAGLSESTELEMNKKAFLPHAIELDDAPEFERFLFITSDSPIDVNSILDQARKMAENPSLAEEENLELPPEFHQYSVLILKGENHEKKNDPV